MQSIKSTSTSVHEVQDPLFPIATAVEPTGECMGAEVADAAPSLLTASPGQRIEKMYELADIFACIFEASPNEHEHAIATTRDAA